MDQYELKAQCLALPGAVEEFPFGDEVSVFKVGGKMFALCSLDGEPLQLSVKCEPDLAVQLRATYPAIAPGYHLNKRHWNTITLDGALPDQMVTDLLGDSYDLVVASLPKARRPASRYSPVPGRPRPSPPRSAGRDRRRPARAGHSGGTGIIEAMSNPRRFPVTVTHLPVTRCQICQRTVAYRPGTVSKVLTEHYRRAHPELSASPPDSR